MLSELPKKFDYARLCIEVDNIIKHANHLEVINKKLEYRIVALEGQIEGLNEHIYGVSSDDE